MTEQWFEVCTIVKVCAADENEAIGRVSAMMQRGYQGEGVFLVADFSARETSDPTVRPSQVDA